MESTLQSNLASGIPEPRAERVGAALLAASSIGLLHVNQAIFKQNIIKTDEVLSKSDL